MAAIETRRISLELFGLNVGRGCQDPQFLPVAALYLCPGGSLGVKYSTGVAISLYAVLLICDAAEDHAEIKWFSQVWRVRILLVGIYFLSAFTFLFTLDMRNNICNTANADVVYFFRI